MQKITIRKITEYVTTCDDDVVPDRIWNVLTAIDNKAEPPNTEVAELSEIKVETA
jgi:hypothetical protein